MSKWAEYPIAQYVDERFPLLRVASADPSPAHSPKVEWTVDTDEGRTTWANYTQIVRTPFRPKDDRELYRRLDQHLFDLEKIFWYGTPMREMDGLPRTFCGGVLHYLGRQPLHADRIRLRILRDVGYREFDNDNGYPAGEFLSEVSLQVVPATPIRPYRPAVPVAWCEGSDINTPSHGQKITV